MGGGAFSCQGLSYGLSSTFRSGFKLSLLSKHVQLWTSCDFPWCTQHFSSFHSTCVYIQQLHVINFYLSHSSGFLSAVPLQQVGCQTVLLTPDRLSNINLSGNCYESTVKIKLKRLDRGGGDISIKHVHLPAMISMKNSSDVQKQSRRVQETQRVLCVQIEEEAGAHRKSLAGSRLIRDGNPMQIMSGNLSRKWEKG